MSRACWSTGSVLNPCRYLQTTSSNSAKTHSDQPSNINISPAALYCSAVKENKVIISLSPLPSNPKLLHNVWLQLSSWSWSRVCVSDVLIGDLNTLFSEASKIRIKVLVLCSKESTASFSFVSSDFHLVGLILVSCRNYFWQRIAIPKEISYVMHHLSLLHVSQNLWYLLPEK